MKRLVTAAAILISVGSSAFAMVTNQGLSRSDTFEARRFVPNADYKNLTAAQVRAIRSVLYSGDENIGGKIRSILLSK